MPPTKPAASSPPSSWLIIAQKAPQRKEASATSVRTFSTLSVSSAVPSVMIKETSGYSAAMAGINSEASALLKMIRFMPWSA